jgi:hypothetical protein
MTVRIAEWQMVEIAERGNERLARRPGAGLGEAVNDLLRSLHSMHLSVEYGANKGVLADEELDIHTGGTRGAIKVSRRRRQRLHLWKCRQDTIISGGGANAVAGGTGSSPRCHSLHSRHRGAAADPGPLIGRASLDIRSVNSSILERNSLRIGEVFELL